MSTVYSRRTLEDGLYMADRLQLERKPVSEPPKPYEGSEKGKLRPMPGVPRVPPQPPKPKNYQMI